MQQGIMESIMVGFSFATSTVNGLSSLVRGIDSSGSNLSDTKLLSAPESNKTEA